MRLTVVSATCAVLLPLTSASAAAQNEVRQVLVLYAARGDGQIAVVGDREIPRVLSAALPEGVDYYAEYLDRGRFSDPAYREAFSSFIRTKYGRSHFDVVIAMQQAALEFLDERRHELFPDTPIVFFAERPVAQRLPNATGIVAPLNLRSTLDLAATLQPEARRVYVVAGADVASRVYVTEAERQFRPLASRFAFTYLAGLTTRDLETQVSKLPPKSIVYYLLVNQDGAGLIVHPLEYLDRLTSVANAPVYSWVDSTIGHGVVGGNLKRQAVATQAVAQLAIRVLRGERADGIPVETREFNQNQVDWRALQRWGLSVQRLPADTLTQFREATAWERYARYIIATAALLAAETLLVVGLWVQMRRRRAAERRLRASEAMLQRTLSDVREIGVLLIDAHEAERAHVASELMDDVSQRLALLAMNLDQLTIRDTPPTADLASEALKHTTHVIRRIHSLSQRLHPGRLDLLGLIPAIDGLARDVTSAGIQVRFTHSAVPATLPAEVALFLYRVAEEGIQSAVRHGQAQSIRVHLVANDVQIVLTVDDDGGGFSESSIGLPGVKLRSLRERLGAMGGSLEIRSAPGSGTRLRAAVPLPLPA